MKKIKRILKSLPKKVLINFLVFAMVLNYILPVKIVLAQTPANANDYGQIQLHGDFTLENKSDVSEITAVFENGSVSITGEHLYSDGSQIIYGNGNIVIDCQPNNNYMAEIWVSGENTHGSTLNLNNYAPGNFRIIDPIFSSTTQQQQPEQTGYNTTATITVSSGAGTYNMNRYNPNTKEHFVQAVDYDDMIDFRINGSKWNPGDDSISYNSDANDNTVVFTFETLWINRYYEDIVINGTSYTVANYIDFDDRTSWLEHNNGEQLVSFSIPDVPKSDSYNIVAKHGENNGTKYIATFLWTSDPEQADTDDYIGNSKLEFVKAVYEVGDETYTITENDIEGHETIEGEYKVFRSADGFLNYGVKNDVDYDDGSLTLPGEAEVTMRVVPKYGYQVTSVNGGGNFTTTDEGVSEFTVVVHNGEAGYFNAEVTKIDDEVISSSDKVVSGNVLIKNGEIDAGTVRLSVDDVELTADKIKDFKEAAGSDYEIKNYLDINLSQVLYKGSADDVWSKDIHHLNNDAIISLVLDEGVDINNIVLVHNIDDGDEFEVIEIDSYDPETRTVTFKTKSFSNYAIATKLYNNSEAALANPKTRDSIVLYTSVFTISLITMIYACLFLRKRKQHN